MINDTNWIDNPRHKINHTKKRNYFKEKKRLLLFSFCSSSANSYKKQRYQQPVVPKKKDKWDRKGTSNCNKNKSKATEEAREVRAQILVYDLRSIFFILWTFVARHAPRNLSSGNSINGPNIRPPLGCKVVSPILVSLPPNWTDPSGSFFHGPSTHGQPSHYRTNEKKKWGADSISGHDRPLSVTRENAKAWHISPANQVDPHGSFLLKTGFHGLVPKHKTHQNEREEGYCLDGLADHFR